MNAPPLAAQTGSISGVVQGIDFHTVEVYTAGGAFVTSATSNGQQSYQISGLPAGDYYVVADALLTNHITQLYSGQSCPLFSCRQNLAGGTLVSVTAGQNTAGIDFQLTLGGALVVRVFTEAGDVIPGARTHIYNALGAEIAVLDGAATDIGGLVPGSYFAVVEDLGGTHDTELWQNQPCGGCTPTMGTPLAVNAGEQRGMIARLVDSHLGFFTVAPCRLVDTRQTGTPLVGFPFQRFSDFSGCGIPPGAVALAVNVTAVNGTASGEIVLGAAGAANHYTTLSIFPVVAYGPGATRASNAILSIARGPGEDNGFLAEALTPPNESVHLVVDVVGYFEPVP